MFIYLEESPVWTYSVEKKQRTQQILARISKINKTGNIEEIENLRMLTDPKKKLSLPTLF